MSEDNRLSDGQRRRFTGVVHEEAQALSDVAEALAAYFDRIAEADRSLTPVDEVEAMFDAALASQVAQKQIDKALGGGKVDAIDFLHIEVQLF